MNPKVKMIETETAPCAWWAKFDRGRRDLENLSCWSAAQIEEVRSVIPLFEAAYTKPLTVVNVNRTHFTFKVFTTSGSSPEMLLLFTQELLRRFKRRYEVEINPRNEILYKIYPN